MQTDLAALQFGSQKNQDISTLTAALDATYDRTVAAILERRFPLACTYRLQFNRFFTFRDAHRITDYLQRLGVSHLYASPFFKARAESLHGYDIASHNELNPSIGDESDLETLVEGLHARGLRMLLDTVPNHMGIGEQSNAWWTDLLENGRASIYAPSFDIDWEPLNTKLTHKVLLPVLGDQYGRVLEKCELHVEFLPAEGRFLLRYWDNLFPIEPRSYEQILAAGKEALLDELGHESEPGLEYMSILTAISHLPAHSEVGRQRAVERNREKEVIKRRLAALCASEPRVEDSIQRSLAGLNGSAGDPRSFDRLDALLEQQPYRLSFWRVATEEINYRRFFDVNDLAAIRVDRPEVFEETHRMILRFLIDGKLDGLRIDHIDGLRDPEGYLHALQRAYFRDMARHVREGQEGTDSRTLEELEGLLLQRFERERAASSSGPLYRPLYVLVEKILGRGERLSPSWAASGTTGYEFANAVNGLFVNGANARAFDEIYEQFTGEETRFGDLLYESKRAIMRHSLSSEVTILTNMLNKISESDRRYRDFTVNGLRHAIREVIAAFPVYRTYIAEEPAAVSETDQRVIEKAVARAIRRNPASDPSIFGFLRDTLLLKGYDEGSEEIREARLEFVMKFQQVTGPVTAKGIEDTAFYVYNRLVSLNEVGGEPQIFGVEPEEFHALQLERLREWPEALLSTSTHDTKRSEDVRARISVLSEMPREWRSACRAWARYNLKHKRQVGERLAPSPNEEYFLYQNLLGIWPFREPEEEEREELVQRLQAYMRKALNEAKVNSSWISPDEEYLAAVSDFVRAILTPGPRNRFLAAFTPFAGRVARYGIFNSLSQTLIKLTSPGVPDIYQGNDLWDFSLVDPDNRRPVDYALRRRLLAEVERIRSAAGAARLLEKVEDGRIKLFVTSRALRFRQEHARLFAEGQYLPLEATGKRRECVVAFARTLKDEAGETEAVVVVPRLVTRLAPSIGSQPQGDSQPASPTPTGAAWEGTSLLLPHATAGDRYRNLFTAEEVEAVEEVGGKVVLPVARIVSGFPVAMLEKVVPARRLARD